MDHRMDVGRGWELEFVGNLPHTLQYKIRVKVPECEFVIGSPMHRLLNVRLKLEINPITDSEFTLNPVFISLVLHSLLSTEKMLMYSLSHSGALIEPFLKISDSRGIGRNNAKVTVWVAIKDLKWCPAKG